MYTHTHTHTHTYTHTHTHTHTHAHTQVHAHTHTHTNTSTHTHTPSGTTSMRRATNPSGFFSLDFLVFCGGCEGMVANHLCRIVVGISSQIGQDGHRDMGDVSTYGNFFRNLLGSMKPLGSNLCADIRRYKYLRASQRVKTEIHLHCVERGLSF